MKSRRNIALLWAFSVVPAIILIIVYQKLPERVPTHFGFDGVVDAYGPRSTLWLLAGLGPLIALMLQFLPRIDPKGQNYRVFQKYYDLFAIFVELFLLAVFGMVVTETLRPGTVAIGRMVTALVSIMLILLGNMMGKIKHNYFFGIRTPWTLADPDVWTRTHSLGASCGLPWEWCCCRAAFCCRSGAFSRCCWRDCWALRSWWSSSAICGTVRNSGSGMRNRKRSPA